MIILNHYLKKKTKIMVLSQQNEKSLLEVKKQNAILVAKTNGRTVLTRRFEGGKTNKYVTREVTYEIPPYFNSFHFRYKYNEARNRCTSKLLGKLFNMQKEEGILYEE